MVGSLSRIYDRNEDETAIDILSFSMHLVFFRQAHINVSINLLLLIFIDFFLSEAGCLR